MMRKLPIIYVRGYAGGTSGVDRQVDDPFYGFNDGSTHVRIDGDGDPKFYQFESPLLRLMIDEDYDLIVKGGQRAFLESAKEGEVPPETIWIHRFYDSAATTYGQKPIEFELETAAQELLDLVLLVRAKTGAPAVYLVAHSMGGLICRCMLQKICREHQPPYDPTDLVAKLFTYATPHGGIAFERGGGLLEWARDTFGPNGSDIFGSTRMFQYLTPGVDAGASPPHGWDPRAMTGSDFPPDRVFCLIGTDPSDYGAALGLSSAVVGAKSDGLVQIENAYVPDASNAFVHRSHSGRYGVVNSEEGYQNLRRFLFGAYKVQVEYVSLQLEQKQDVHWQGEVRLSVRGLPVVMHEQLAAHYCPVQLEEEMHKVDSADAPIPLVTTFLLKSGRESGISRYALHLRVISLREHNGFFNWNDHLEQTADWDDILIVDVGRDAADRFSAWHAWNSKVVGAISDYERIGDELKLEPGEPGGMRGTVPLPEAARPMLGPAVALRLTISAWS
jgi:hypothetical protein